MKDYTNLLNWSDQEILDEIEDIRYLYRQKQVMRWGLDRIEEYESESVAEHIYGMQVLANFFLPLEDPENEMDHYKIFQMMLWHDAEEIETGDIMTFKKTEEDSQKGRAAFQDVVEHAPELLQEKIKYLVDEYEEQASRETRFVKAIDKLEPEVHVMSEAGKRRNIEHIKLTREQLDYIYDKGGAFIKEFPYLMRFHNTIKEYRIKNKFYVDHE